MVGFGLQKYIITAGLYITAYFLHSSVILADSIKTCPKLFPTEY